MATFLVLFAATSALAVPFSQPARSPPARPAAAASAAAAPPPLQQRAGEMAILDISEKEFAVLVVFWVTTLYVLLTVDLFGAPRRRPRPPTARAKLRRAHIAHHTPRSAALPPVVALLDFADMAGPYVGIILMAACLCALAFAAFKYRETLTKTVLQLVGRLIKRKR